MFSLISNSPAAQIRPVGREGANMPTGALKRLLSQTYDSERAFHIYQTSSNDLSTLAGAMVPLVRIVLGSEFKYLDPMVKDELIAAALAKLHEALVNRRCKYENAQQFTVYHYWLIKRTMLAWLKNMSQTAVSQENFRSISFRTTVRMRHPLDVETAIYVTELPNEILRRVLQQIRFRGRESEACRYIAQRLTSGRRVVKEVLVKEFERQEPEFFLQYVRMLTRKPSTTSRRNQVFETLPSRGSALTRRTWHPGGRRGRKGYFGTDSRPRCLPRCHIPTITY
jgi:hypothetical protein